MKPSKSIHPVLTILISLVWLANGLFCKILNLEPRHEEIVSHIVGTEYSHTLTILIGLAEIVMFIWILSRYFSRFNAITQIAVILTMNLIEFFVVPDLLLFGRLNILFAILFCLVIYINEFKLKPIA